MALQNNILRNPHGSPHLKIPFIFCMINTNGVIVPITWNDESSFPFGKEDTVYGVELMVNPRTLSSNLAKLVTRSQSMTSYIEDHWGEELDTITIQGHTAAFVTGGSDIYGLKLSTDYNSVPRKYLKEQAGMQSLNKEEPAGPYGLTVSERKKSMSYIQFKRLIDIIRLNGCVYDSFGLVKQRYYIMVSFGNAAYKGFFENIDITESATNPFQYQYTITFKSEETLYSYINKGING